MPDKKITTVQEFVVLLRDAARAQPRPVLAVDFEPTTDGRIQVIFRFKQLDV